MSVPTGKIKANAGGDGSWENITRYDEFIRAAADPVGWPIARVRGHIVIETGETGDPRTVQRNDSNGWSYGLMQVVPFGVGWEGWHVLVKEKAGLPRSASRDQVVNALYDPKINIAVGVAILEGFYQQYQRGGVGLDAASSAFFLGNPDWRGNDTVNGNTGFWYRDTLAALIKEQQAFAPPDYIAVILGDYDGYNNFFGFAKDTSLPYYDYGRGHGLNGWQHTGYDIETYLGQPLYSPGDGVITCAGTNSGSGTHGSSCAAFPDYYGKRAGRVEILLDAGPSVILGHCSEALLPVGTRVKMGDAVATAGGMNSLHVHLEVRTWRNGAYTLVDPATTLAAALGGGPITLPPTYARRLPVPQPADFDAGWEVAVVADSVPTLQSTAPGAPEVGPALVKGETFQAVYLTIGQDGKPWWITSLGSRVPLKGTMGESFDPRPPDECPDPVICPPDRAHQLVKDILAVIEAYPKDPVIAGFAFPTKED